MKKAANIFLVCAAFCTLVLLNNQSMETNVVEIWKDIPGFEEYYEASYSGQIRSKPRLSYNGRTFGQRVERIKKWNKVKGGYYQTPLCTPDVKKPFYVHRLVASAWIPNPDNKPFINHKDGDKGNNSVPNLEWCTRSENVLHAYRTGLMSNQGIKHPQAKLTEQDVLNIRERYAKGESSYKIFNSGDYDMSYTNIKDIIAKRTWSHI